MFVKPDPKTKFHHGIRTLLGVKTLNSTLLISTILKAKNRLGNNEPRKIGQA